MSTPLLVGLLLAAAAICYVLAPLVVPGAFVAKADDAPVPSGDPLERLRDELCAQIVALDFERDTGKTDEEEYLQDRAALKRRALAVLRTIDERAADDADPTADAVEQAVSIARARRTPPPLPDDADDPALLELDDEVERQVSALRQSRHLPAAPRE